MAPQMIQFSIQLHPRVKFHCINLRKKPKTQEIVSSWVEGLVLGYPRKYVSLKRILIKISTLWNKFEVNDHRNCNRIKFCIFFCCWKPAAELEELFYHLFMQLFSQMSVWSSLAVSTADMEENRKSLIDHLYIHCLLHEMTTYGCTGKSETTDVCRVGILVMNFKVRINKWDQSMIWYMVPWSRKMAE